MAGLHQWHSTKICAQVLKQSQCASRMSQFYPRHFSTSIILRNHYEALECHPDADGKKIKSQFYKLSLKYHPDRNNSEEAHKKFLKISEAYSILGHEASRREYDRTINRGSSARHASVSRSRFSASRPIRRSPTVSATPFGVKPGSFNHKEHYEKHYGEELRAQAAQRRQWEREKSQEKAGEGSFGRFWKTCTAFGIMLVLAGTFTSSLTLPHQRRKNS
ncbi:uncharacterized protein VTP21DRAFT_8483 [Calcarisporiella thermophila]|uniref:uncharacterized protein n=1 Tax=Calcarisporiella thermophila TaxID=911321 RepID=UPI003743DF99